MPTPGQISKENLKQILVFFPAVVYNICVVLFSFQLNYTTQKRICPACGLQILFCLLGAFFHSPIADGSRKFARKLARPPDFVRGTWMRFGELSSLLILGSGGRRLRTRAFFPANGLGYGGLCPHPPRNLRFLGFSICCRPFGRRTLRTRAQAQAATTAAQRHHLAPTPHQKRTPAVEPPPRRRRLRCPCAAAVARGLRPPFRLFPRTIRPGL